MLHVFTSFYATEADLHGLPPFTFSIFSAERRLLINAD
jgi:hypothetical protein